MDEKLDNRLPGDNVLHVAEFAVCPPPRCCRRLGDFPEQVCGQIASCVVRGRWWFEDRTYCRHCAPDGAIELPAPLAVRRVRLTIEVYVAGTSGHQPAAQREALEHVRRALADAGVVMDLRDVQSTFGRYPALLVPHVQSSIGER